MNYLFTKILGEFELERFIRRLSIGVVLTIVITIWMGVTEGFGHEGQLLLQHSGLWKALHMEKESCLRLHQEEWM